MILRNAHPLKGCADAVGPGAIHFPHRHHSQDRIRLSGGGQKLQALSEKVRQQGHTLL